MFNPNWKHCRDITSPKKRTDKFVFLSWWLGNTWNLKSRQARKTNSSVCFLGEDTARQFCFEIYWPLGQARPPTLLYFIFSSKFYHVHLRHLLRFFDCLVHPNQSATFATDQKWPFKSSSYLLPKFSKVPLTIVSILLIS